MLGRRKGNGSYQTRHGDRQADAKLGAGRILCRHLGPLFLVQTGVLRLSKGKAPAQSPVSLTELELEGGGWVRPGRGTRTDGGAKARGRRHIWGKVGPWFSGRVQCAGGGQTQAGGRRGQGWAQGPWAPC